MTQRISNIMIAVFILDLKRQFTSENTAHDYKFPTFEDFGGIRRIR